MNRWIDAEWLSKLFPDTGEGDWTYNATAQGYIDSAPSIDICFCEKCMFADEEPIADGRYWCALHQCFMRFCSDGKEESE